MKDMIIKNWEGSIAIDTTGRDMAEVMEEWTDEKEKAREIILESRSYNEAYATMCDLGFTDGAHPEGK